MEIKALCGECVWETGDRKSSPLSSRRQPTFTNHLSVLIAAITQGDNNTHSGPDPPENSLLLRIIRLYCIYSAATVWTTKWARWDSGWTDRLRICPDYAVIGSQADRQGGNPAEGNTSQGGRHDKAGQHVNVLQPTPGRDFWEPPRPFHRFLTDRETTAAVQLCNIHLVISWQDFRASFGFLTTNLKGLIYLLLKTHPSPLIRISQSADFSWLYCTDLLYFCFREHLKFLK